MTFETHITKQSFGKYIESMFYFKGFMPDHSIERVVPTGHLFIIFELDGIPRNTFNNSTLKANKTYTKVWISGIHKNYISISAHQESEMFVIQFKPYGGYPFFHFPIHELNEKVISAKEIFGNTILDLRQKILEQDTSQEKFSIAEKWLDKRFDSEKIPSSELIAVFEQFNMEPTTRYDQIIKRFSKTQKHLIYQFKKYSGLTPKYYQRILRFNKILQQIQNKEHIEWSQVAYQFGYADQSHFIKEFKLFSGFNPEEYIKQDLNYKEPNFFPLDHK